MRSIIINVLFATMIIILFSQCANAYTADVSKNGSSQTLFVSPRPGEGLSQLAERNGLHSEKEIVNFINQNKSRLVNRRNPNLIYTWQKFELKPASKAAKNTKAANIKDGLESAKESKKAPIAPEKKQPESKPAQETYISSVNRQEVKSLPSPKNETVKIIPQPKSSAKEALKTNPRDIVAQHATNSETPPESKLEHPSYAWDYKLLSKLFFSYLVLLISVAVFLIFTFLALRYGKIDWKKLFTFKFPHRYSKMNEEANDIKYPQTITAKNEPEEPILPYTLGINKSGVWFLKSNIDGSEVLTDDLNKIAEHIATYLISSGRYYQKLASCILPKTDDLDWRPPGLDELRKIEQLVNDLYIKKGFQSIHARN